MPRTRDDLQPEASACTENCEIRTSLALPLSAPECVVSPVVTVLPRQIAPMLDALGSSKMKRRGVRRGNLRGRVV